MRRAHTTSSASCAALAMRCQSPGRPQDRALDQHVALEQPPRGPHHERRGLGIIGKGFEPHIQMSGWMLDPQIAGNLTFPTSIGGKRARRHGRSRHGNRAGDGERTVAEMRHEISSGQSAAVCGGAISTGLGMTRSAASGMPMRCPASIRVFSSRAMNALSALNSLTVSCPVLPKSRGARDHDRHGGIDA